MPRRTEVKCQVCLTAVPNCSVLCFKEHKVKDCSLNLQPSTSIQPELNNVTLAEDGETKDLLETANLRPLTSLKWPYVPDDSSYEDPLKRDDPKPLKLKDYEAIATSREIRQILASNPGLPALLREVDKLRGKEREETLESLLGVSLKPPAISVAPGDVDVIKDLAAAIEKSVRGAKHDMLGLDWD
ncbi:hypothetical protein Clacol_009819 [Clathrus columnatus]|uniref:HIT-type domain-containing protein n=1 Tax=Clathrus columnatus TaxID=1419009 RepID=A0AAV5ALL1_9AGAM|nr:hypothetical protein Clacol_009819 [Clathrus columnatus]